MNRWLLYAFAALVLSGTACGKVSGCNKEEASAPAPSETAAPETPRPGRPSPAQVPVKEDFERWVEREVTEDNYEAQLEALAKEIEAP